MIGLNFIWHMHQPDYRLAGRLESILPWVRLHAARGYVDLLSVLKRFEHAQCCVNFSGILLEQLMAYSPQSRDSFATLSLRSAGSLDETERAFVAEHFFSADANTLIKPHARYWELYCKRDDALRQSPRTALDTLFTDEELGDLLVWFNLAWIGFHGQRLSEVRELVMQGRGFSLQQQRQVIEIHDQLLASVLPGYAELAADGRIELSFTPHYHPILPLLCDLAGVGYQNSADPLPEFRHPEDAKEQVERGMRAFQVAFGSTPKGCWPAEGSVSDAALAVIAEAGLIWAATDQQNLPSQPQGPLAHLGPWNWIGGSRPLALFFRDTRLSDNIGFDYATWHPALAAQHLVDMVRSLGPQAPFQSPLISVVMDGENAWEHYPDGAESFLNQLFERIAAAADISCLTPSAALERAASNPGGIPVTNSVHSGSWIGGNFNIWSRHAETRKAWRVLAAARQALAASDSADAHERLLAAEGSDSFWWYGDDFVSDSHEQFDLLFRQNLIAAYEAAGQSAPEELYVPICSVYQQQSLPLPSGLICPEIDGVVGSYFEWLGAVEADLAAGQSSMARSATQNGIAAVHLGFSEDSLFLCISAAQSTIDRLLQSGGFVHICLVQPGVDLCVGFTVPAGSKPGRIGPANLGINKVIELRIGIDSVGLQYGEVAYLWVELGSNDGENLRYPASGRFPLLVIPRDFALRNWAV